MTATFERAVPPRADVPDTEQWDLESVFSSDAAWEAAYAAVAAMLPELAGLAGRLGESAETLLTGLRLLDWLQEAVEPVMVYASLRRSEDATNSRSAALAERARSLSTRVGAAAAFVDPELAALSDQQIAKYFAIEPGLETYRFAVERVRRRRAHIRSVEVESVLARAGEMAAMPHVVHQVLEDGELPLGAIRAESGAEVRLAQGNLDRYLRSADRRVRKEAWERSADAYLSFRHTFGATLVGAVKRDVFYARARGYDSSLAAALDDDNIPIAVFHNLLDTVWANFPIWHRYFRARRRLLGLAEGDLHGYDLTAPLATNPSVGWERGVELMLASLAPLGEPYVATVDRGIAQRWVDRCANLGKGGGAFSGGCYGTFPFISMTWEDSLTSVSTLAHEVGHSMHSYLTWQKQPITYADYGMSAAETASNLNQALLGAYLLDLDQGRDWTLTVIEERIANYQRYLFLFPILARFELACHERAERDEALTADWMSATLLDLFRQGYGDELVIDAPRIGVTWARFPHLFANFYVFQYGVGISAAAALAGMIREESEPAVERYLDFLRAGGSRDPIDALRAAGVDLTSPAPIQRAFDLLAGYVDQLEALAG